MQSVWRYLDLSGVVWLPKESRGFYAGHMTQQQNNTKNLQEIASLLALAILRLRQKEAHNSLDFRDNGSVYATTDKES